MKILGRITTSLSVIILAVCCLALLLFGVSKTGWKALGIPTGSMRPSIPPGSLVLVHSVPASQLKVGDVITYTNPANPATTISHRIIKKYLIGGRVPGFVTKGDSNKIADEPIAYGSVKGKVVWHAPHLGYLLIGAKRPLFILPFIYIAGLIIMTEEVLRLRDYLKSNQPYKLPGRADRLLVPASKKSKAAFGISVVVLLVILGVTAGSRVSALIRGNTVTLANNRITVAATHHQCSGNNTNNVNVNNSTTQNASSGNATSSGGSASSGNANNNSSSSVTVTTTNC